MGSGKSTVGPKLAERLGCSFVDLDQEIERRAGCSIQEIFAREGEPEFRRMERECIEAAAERAGVVALGGGAIAQAGVAEWLAATGRVVYLRATPEQLATRVGTAVRRPLLAGLDDAERLEKLQRLLEERRSAYETAEIAIDVGGASADETVAELSKRLMGAC